MKISHKFIKNLNLIFKNFRKLFFTLNMSEHDFSDDGVFFLILKFKNPRNFLQLDMDDGNTLSPAPSANNDQLCDSKRQARAQHVKLKVF